ncbi:Rhodanese-related sulfurtransferase [Virgibacillus subterraneus]|uniref:Rhodanese-related sulfurtransferase n=2 Tax=Virgibacillus TaxID=84406 RepID=A0A1H0ZRK8_9BACI|nr:MULTISPECIES: rhodanese-like domain-containing protein [Virgibacillus]SDQ30009.1 Rhodanese-related sulfurtransferase [Virgibacillus salinus]SEP97872.1 Rhodanese-related sulfurtransferase [Virgibacillus subterraneus]
MDHINEVTPKEVENLIEKDNDTVVLDVREDEEVAQGKIPNAKHIPLEKIPHSMNDLDKGKDYVLVCRSGNRSMTAASFMDEHGFKVSNMAGGMMNWNGEVIV